MIDFTLSRLAHVVSGDLRLAASDTPDTVVSGAVDTDSRLIGPGDIFVAKPDQARLIRYLEDGTRKGPLPEAFTLLEGDEVLVGLELYKGDERLAGSISATWSGMTDAVTVLPALEPNRFRVVARKSGVAQLAAKTADLEAGFSVEVMP